MNFLLSLSYLLERFDLGRAEHDETNGRILFGRRGN